MPRILRGLADNYIYHVLNRGNGKQKVFHKNGDYDSFVTLMCDAKRRHPLQILGYCIMPNHFHFVLRPCVAKNVSDYMQWLMTSHVRRYHTHNKTSGHVWQGRFKSFIVQEDEHLLTVLRYVEGNPVRAGLVRSADEWSWSSHAENAGTRTRHVTDDLPVELPHNWTSVVNTALSELNLDDIHGCVNRQSPYGDQMWQAITCRKLGIESTLHPRGRPRGWRKSSLSPL